MLFSIIVTQHTPIFSLALFSLDDVQVLRFVMNACLPEDAHIRVSGKVVIHMTQVFPYKKLKFSVFESKYDSGNGRFFDPRVAGCVATDSCAWVVYCFTEKI